MADSRKATPQRKKGCPPIGSADVGAEPPFLSARELADRWRCSRSSVDRIARRAGLTRLCLGEGTNGMVRFLRNEVEAFEQSRCVRSVG